MATTQLTPSPILRVWDNAGNLAIGGSVYTYIAGTTTPVASYTDSTGATPNTNPIILNSRGECSVWLTAGQSYKIVANDASGNLLWTKDNIVNTDLSGSNGSSLVGFIQAGTGAVATTSQAKMRQTTSIKDFGALGNGVANDTAALQAAIAYAVTLGKGQVVIPEGTYVLTAGTNFATANISIIGQGKVTFDFSAGTGIGFKLDAGGSGAIVQGMRIENIYIKGGPSITYAFYARGITRSIFRNIEVKEATTAGFALFFNVLNTFDHCIISDDTGAQTTKPANYWYLDDDGTVGNHTQANTFVNCEASGIGAGSAATGFTLSNAILNVWLGGTAESLQNGINILNDYCRHNSWHSFDMEDNRGTDVIVKGYSNSFYGSFAQSTLVTDNISITTGVSTLFSGGYYRKINCTAGSSDTTFNSITLDDNVALGIQGTGTYKRYSCITNTGGVAGNKTGTMPDVLGYNNTGVVFNINQGVTPTGTTTLNEATLTGQMINLRGAIAFTSAGTAAQPLLVDFAGYNAKATSVKLPVGSWYYTTSGGTRYTGTAYLNTNAELAFVCNAATSIFGINPAVTVANGDTFYFDVTYPAS